MRPPTIEDIPEPPLRRPSPPLPLSGPILEQIIAYPPLPPEDGTLPTPVLSSHEQTAHSSIPPSGVVNEPTYGQQDPSSGATGLRTVHDSLHPASDHSRLRTVNVLPIILSNNVCVDRDDGVEYLTTYKINRDLDSVDVLTSARLATLHQADLDTVYVVGSTLNISSLVTL
ncbi:hypothetical protein C8J57DRAFT_1729621, partial [Mycena rebaudengoi]